MGFLRKIFKSYSEKEIKRIMPIVEKINSLEPEMEKLSDKELADKTPYFKQELANGKTLDDILPEAFAVVREASKRVLGLRHFDVQLMGGIILHQGRIAEMKTGEGKTLVATLPLYLNALTGKGVHLITVNEYLAKYQGEMMGKLYNFLGMSVGIILSRMSHEEKQKAYNADITYGTNNEYGFDYLRDNMVIFKNQMVQRDLNYAIVDEIDSILIDEARTPLIISGRADKSSDLYKKANDFVKRLSSKVLVKEDIKDEEQMADNENYDYIVNLKSKTATLTQKGTAKAESFFNLENLNDLNNSDIVHNINQALKAHGVMKKDIDYIVKDGEVLIIDEFTGRTMYGRRYSDGLHQAIEAKEGVKIADESKTLATITFQNFFRMYGKLSGMTGTAMTEENEFREIYNLDVIEIPTNKPVIRKDNQDIIYNSEEAKYKAVIEDIKESYNKKQPVLVGTVSIEKSEKLSALLKREGIPHEVLNAKYHEKEAEIIAQAGKAGAITIATNMAGRGTDILLGGNSEFLAKQELRKQKYSEELISQANTYNETSDEEVLEIRKKFKELQKQFDEEIKAEKEEVIKSGGLKIIGTERHEARRIDNQLRGRSGRQGDPGESRFYISLEDDLMRIFGGETVKRIYDSISKTAGDIVIENPIITKAVETAQKTVENRNFSIRKHILQFDDVMNMQREIIYKQRRQVLDEENMKDKVIEMINSTCELIVGTYSQEISENNLNKTAILSEIGNRLNIPSLEALEKEHLSEKEILDELKEKALKIYEEKEQSIGSEELRNLERIIILKVVDEKWMDHIDSMDALKNGIGLRAYGQKDPVVQYRIEGFDMFDQMVVDIKLDVTRFLLHIVKPEKVERKSNVKITGQGFDQSGIASNVNIEGESAPKRNTTEKQQPIVNDGPKVGRNDPCPCGSGKKYKNCCGK